MQQVSLRNVPFNCQNKYNAHKKFMNGFACRGFDPYGVIISTGRCQKTLEYKSAKEVLL